MNIDLSNLTQLQLLAVLLVTAAIDTLSGIFGAIGNHTFSLSVVADFLESHVLKRVFPILGLGFLGQTLGSGQSGAAIWASALLGLAAYVAETIVSVQSNLTAPSPAPVVAPPPVVPPKSA